MWRGIGQNDETVYVMLKWIKLNQSVGDALVMLVSVSRRAVALSLTSGRQETGDWSRGAGRVRWWAAAQVRSASGRTLQWCANHADQYGCGRPIKQWVELNCAKHSSQRNAQSFMATVKATLFHNLFSCLILFHMCHTLCCNVGIHIVFPGFKLGGQGLLQLLQLRRMLGLKLSALWISVPGPTQTSLSLDSK